uniref:EF-hand domain-containing protein n=1 Tax=Rhodnius prolixus TaxID=13249 RepID=T1HCG8_RHOPR
MSANSIAGHKMWNASVASGKHVASASSRRFVVEWDISYLPESFLTLVRKSQFLHLASEELNEFFRIEHDFFNLLKLQILYDSQGKSEFWRRKMRTFHRILDINKDGVVSFDDFKILVDRFVYLGHLTPQHQKEFNQVVQSMWEERWGTISPYNLVTTEQYLEDMFHIVNDKQLRKKVHNFLPYLFKAVDKDKNGYITEEEFKLFYNCLGLPPDVALVSFTSVDENFDGKVTLQEFVKTGREFFLTEDQRKPSKLFWGPLVK